ncbi:hypothetical protein [Paenibacillus sp. 481]|uniref:hypothetical protein n=1 Tax=Paenibacillus sp. 481 TaxID=2835869 RepID=UPI001E360757|nr:hypothetical protein [Paenibacillus sp. 481]UHA72210.1 hypothetical protein KIK04_16100 [Paenibacillus sp. 481]
MLKKAVQSVQKVDVRSIVPTKYFTANQGEYNSYDEVYKAFGKTKKLSNVSNHEGIVVNTVDEFAALLAYLKDQSTGTVTTVTNVTNESKVSPQQTFTRTVDAVIFDMKLYWIRGYATVDYDSKGVISNISASSSLLGVTFARTWKPDTPHISYVAENERKITYTGTLDHNVFVGGVGTIVSERVSDWASSMIAHRQ